MSTRQLALLLVVAAGAFALALTLGRATRSPAAALPAVPAAERVSMSGAGRPVAIPALKTPRRAVARGVSGGGGQRPSQAQAPAPAATARPSVPSAPAPKLPSAPPGGGDVIVSG